MDVKSFQKKKKKKKKKKSEKQRKKKMLLLLLLSEGRALPVRTGSWVAQSTTTMMTKMKTAVASALALQLERVQIELMQLMQLVWLRIQRRKLAQKLHRAMMLRPVVRTLRHDIDGQDKKKCEDYFFEDFIPHNQQHTTNAHIFP